MVKTLQCNCCEEIWATDNMVKKPIGDKIIYLCPNCNQMFDKDYVKSSDVESARKEISKISVEVPYENAAFDYGVKFCETDKVLDVLNQLIKK